MRSKPRLIPLLMLALALASVPAPASVAPAGTTRAISVDKVADHLPALGCTLREAIRVANEGWTGIHLGCTVIQSGSGIPITYHINLPKGGYTYVLTGAAAEDSNSSGDLDITANVTINGPAAGSTIIDGGGIDRVFHICPGGGCGNTVTFHSIAIRNGNVDGHGGGICSYSGTTTMDSSTVSANSATSHGGGIYNQATLIVQNGSAIGGTGAGNSSSNSGGGIYNYYGTVTVEDSTVSANVASVLGGGIYNGAGTTTVDGSTVSANSADLDGGGIYNAGTLTVQHGSTIGGAGAGNTASEGGGIYNRSTGAVTVDGSTVSANSTDYDGGGIHNVGTLHVQNGSTIGGAGAGNRAASGGGIWSAIGAVTVDSSTVSANSATSHGGGIYNLGTLHVQNGSTIGGAGAGNTAGNQGGGIYTQGTTIMTGSRILHNGATTNGGGVYSTYNTAGATSVTGSCMVGNSAISFLNNWSSQQIATGNWWGAATGPNTPGADTVLGNVDVSGHLTAPILGCAPDLQVSKADDTAGNGTVGTPFHWTLTVSNTGSISATFTAGETILRDDLPTGPTYGSPVLGSVVDVDNSADIQCGRAASSLTCTAVGGGVTLGALSGSFQVTFSVTPGDPVTLVNPAGVCQVDPNGDVNEGDESNNHCAPSVVHVVESSSYVYLPLVLK